MTIRTPPDQTKRYLGRLSGWFGVFFLLVGLGTGGCQPAASDCSDDTDCASGLVCAGGGGLLVRGGVCVLRENASQQDAGSTDTNPGDDDADAGNCEPKTCDELDTTCGVVSDGCGHLLQCGEDTCIASVSAGPEHSCVVRGDGSIYCWGGNEGGQLGSGDFDPSATPQPVVMSSVDFKAKMVSTGSQHSCALNPSGRAWCWGSNKLVGSGDCFGQLGTGDDCATLPRTNRPAIAVNLAQVEPTVIAIQTHENYNCMRNSAGHVYCWGSGAHGQLGNAQNLAKNPTPSPVQGVDLALDSLGLSACYACALAPDALVCWGDFSRGCTGDGTNNQAEIVFDTHQFDPSVCVGPNGCLAGGRAHTCFIDHTGTAYCYNDNKFGQLGIDPATANSPTPVAVEGLSEPVIQLVAGDRFSCAMQDTGEVYCWGDNTNGQLGDGTHTASFEPVQVDLSAPAVRISAGNSHACAALDSGELQCWGSNAHGQLGNGQSGDGGNAATPVTVQF